MKKYAHLGKSLTKAEQKNILGGDPVTPTECYSICWRPPIMGGTWGKMKVPACEGSSVDACTIDYPYAHHTTCDCSEVPPA